LPALLSAIVVLAQLFHRAPLVDVVTGAAPAGVRLSYPIGHVYFAPFTLPADWLNGGSRHDIIGFMVWAVLLFALARLFGRGAGGAPTASPAIRGAREAAVWALFVLSISGFIAWAAFLPRPIPRLVADDPEALVFDIHSHTALSHDGRPGFDAAANAAWHARAGFDAAFVTDHNRFGAAKQWRIDAPFRKPRLLDGEELSLSGLHLIVLGNTQAIDNRGFNTSWDSTGVLVRRLAIDSSTHSSLQPPFLIASLPEYWRKHWGAELGELVGWGVAGFEIWTTAPRAMDFPLRYRREVIARARLSGLTLFGATDMHGYGNAATVWNVARLPGWRALGDPALTAALIGLWRRERLTAHRVIALGRWQPSSRLGSAAAVPRNAWLVLRTASHGHGAALLAWISVSAILLARRKPKG
jgi:hypothetical protein